MREIRKHIVRMATENNGFWRIQGAVKNLGHQVAASTIAKVLHDHGIKPAPERPSSWRSFIKTHANVIVGADFFTTEGWTARGLLTYYTLFFIEHGSRAVCIAGCAPNPDERFMLQIARNVTDSIDGFLLGKRFLIVERDTILQEVQGNDQGCWHETCSRSVPSSQRECDRREIRSVNQA